MKTRSFLLAGVFALASFAASAQQPIESQQVYKDMLSPVVQLNRTCSASVIQSDETGTILLTAKHCVVDDQDKTQEVYVPVYQNNRIVREELYKAKVKSVSYEFDLALVSLIDKTAILPTVILAPSDRELYEGEATWTVGWPAGLNRTITMGTFGGRAEIAFPNSSKDTEYFRATQAITGGNSGGALFHKLESGAYEQIGVTSAGRRDANFINYYVPIDQIRTYLAKDKLIGVARTVNTLLPPGIKLEIK